MRHGFGSAKLDRHDRAILDILQSDNMTPQRLIAEKVNLSAAAVHRRIRRLQDEGVVVGNVAVVDPVLMGCALTMVVELHVRRTQVAALDTTCQSFIDDPGVQQCYRVTGGADFVLIVNVASMSAYEALTRRLFLSNHNVTQFRTLVVMDRVKASLAMPLCSD
ncbi:AsnC family transcriptional regulator [Ensifer sp. NM-2]|nr:Lrp/AsnC family transcriptional regulator [Ensifer sp. NM-2]PSS61908.1 AsnC family transcriptional regulator [Ensifer sp. NM-2]